MIGQTISHYRVISQIGAGGMGVVYAAEDSRLGRSVALKFLPEDLAKDVQAIERLKSEARTASSLNHANICTIYDIGEHEGRPFIVMELLEGQSLRDRLSAGTLRVQETLNLGIQVSDALDSAHRRKIIHRDLKPENLFLLERGRVKILDFGLAKLTERPAVPTTTTGTPTHAVTAEGLTLGTVAYMSPEQVMGETLDSRTDLFSLGVVLYECVTGTQPFRGKTSGVVLSGILNKAPVAPAAFNPDLPLRLQEVINNCLEKDRELRYPDAAALRADLLRMKRDMDSGVSGAVRTGPRPEGAMMPAPSATGTRWAEPDEDASADTTAAVRVGRPGERPSERPSERMSRAAAAPAPRRTHPGILAAAGLVIVAAAAAAFYVVSSRPSAVPPATPAAQVQTAGDRQAIDSARARLNAKDYRAALAQAEDLLRTSPGQPDALRIRDEAGAMIARFDEAIARGNRQLASGDTAGVAAALNEARAIDPASQAVAELSAGLLAAYRGQSPAPSQARSARPPADSRSSASSSNVPPPAPAPAVSAPVPAPSAPVPAPSNPPPAASTAQPVQPPVSAPPAPLQPPQATPQAPSVATASPPDTSQRTASPPDRGAAPASVEDDEAAIRNVVATYARAIEEKDLRLFRSVKPNLSADEQRALEEGFKAVTSQRVQITILSIRPTPPRQEASVLLRRRDTIQAAGRQQTVDTQQTLTVVRTPGGWVIRSIGR